ncbi:MAG: DMT family transporter [Saprospiraceae bacterium]
MSSKFKAHAALSAVALIYGANYTIAKVILDGEYIQPYALTLLRVASGVIFFWLFHGAFVKEKIERQDIPLFILCGLTGVAINQMLFIAGLKLTTHINAALIMTATPILVLVASWFLLKEPITGKKVLGIGLGIAGAAILIIYGKKFAFTKDGLLGDIMIFLNATSFGIYLVIVKTLMRKYNPLTVAKWIFTFGIFFVLPFGTHELINTPMNAFTPRIWLAVAYVLICTTFFAYLFNAIALKLVSPSTVSIYIYLQPLIATAIALLFGKDELTIIKVAAGAFIFTGVFLVSRR